MHGILFDWNGTLFWDSDLHDIAWKAIVRKYVGRELSDNELREHFHGKTNSMIARYIMQVGLSSEIQADVASEKETLYRELCDNDPKRLMLAPGAQEFLDNLKQNNFPIAIGTAAGLQNIEFYIDRLGIDRWFSMDRIIYDDGTFPGKPAPDVYIRAAKSLNLNPSDCTVFEDSLSGVKAAVSAGAGMIVAVNSEGSKDIAQLTVNPAVNRVIKDFREISKWE